MTVAVHAEQIARMAYVDRPGDAERSQRVAEHLAGDPEAAAVAWLHLVGDVMVPDLGGHVGLPTEVAAAVDALTRRAGEHSEAFRDRMLGSRLAMRVKIAAMAVNGGSATE